MFAHMLLQTKVKFENENKSKKKYMKDTDICNFENQFKCRKKK